MSARIISDSACDMTQRRAKEKGVIILPPKAIIDGVEHSDGVTITAEEFYENPKAVKNFPPPVRFHRRNLKMHFVRS